ncbi:MAG: hypothetical protein ACK4KU_14675 [Acinetobacter sp.]|uniref:hypothetical protein n=1 Tax=Acinetobacter sp. TaxID=472 RepID=UPI0039190812
MQYPIRATFFELTKAENDYGEVISTAAVAFSTGCRAITMNYKDALQGGLSLDGERQYIYVRKNPNTLSVKIGDEVTLNKSPKTYKVLGIDPKLISRGELMFLVDALESSE